MSTFGTFVRTVEAIEPIEGADNIEVAVLGDYRSIVKKGSYQPGDLTTYIQEQSLVPDSILTEMGLTGRLSGSLKNRVKIIKLRGVYSQGLCYPPKPEWQLGQDVSEELGIIKWEQELPPNMKGKLGTIKLNGPYHSIAFKYDIENIKNHKNAFQENELVQISEKAHGSLAMFVYLPQAPVDEQFVFSSKGLFARGVQIKDCDENKDNVWIKLAHQIGIHDKLKLAHSLIGGDAVYIMGEVLGVQDLKYGLKPGQLDFRCFDVYSGVSPQGRFLNDIELDELLKQIDLKRVEVLYRGPYSKEKVLEFTDGYETTSGKQLHIREGVVVKPQVERQVHGLGRLVLKSVSNAYLLRKGDVTEFE